MIIVIDENRKIVSSLSGELAERVTPDGTRSFRVERMPILGVGEELLFDPATRAFEIRKKEVPDAETVQSYRAARKRREQAEKVRTEVLAWFAENDWKVNKFTLGEWEINDPRWTSYLAERLEKRAAYDAAIEILKQPLV